MTRIIDILMSRGAFIAIAIACTGGLAYEIYFLLLAHHGNLGCLNWINITVMVALTTGLYLAGQIDNRLRQALQELWLQGTLRYVNDPTDDLQRRILERHRRSEIVSAFLFMMMMIIVYTPFYPQVAATLFSTAAETEIKQQTLLLVVLPIAIGIVSGFVAGAFFGRLATYGSTASVVAKLEELRIQPMHFDGANGLRPVGNFYLYQAVLTAVPLVWLAGWAFSYAPFAQYQQSACGVPVIPWFTWQAYAQWLLVATYAYIGFVRPVLALRRKLVHTRTELIRKRLPEIEGSIVEFKQKLEEPFAAGAMAAFESRLRDLAREHWSIRNMRVWPMDLATLRKYAPIEIGTKLLPLVVGPLFSKEGEHGRLFGVVPEWATTLIHKFRELIF